MGQMWCFSSSTSFTTADEFLNMLGHAQPVEAQSAEGHGTITSLVTHVTVAFGEYQTNEVRRQKYLTGMMLRLPVQNAVLQ